jgi:hypothetical protein
LAGRGFSSIRPGDPKGGSLAGSGKVVNTCELVDAVGPLELADLKQNGDKSAISSESLKSVPYSARYAWVLKNAYPLTVVYCEWGFAEGI